MIWGAEMGKLRGVIGVLLVLAMSSVWAEPAAGLVSSQVQMEIVRVQVQEGVSFDDAVESLKLRANQHNLKFVGVNQLYKEIAALTGKPARRMEIFNFCDGLTADKMLRADPLMIAFMPCRIALLEDASGKRWVISMMMEAQRIRALPEDARKGAERVLAAMKDMMLAASNGDL